MAGMWGAILGRSATMVASILCTRNPPSARSRPTSSSKTRLDMPLYFGSESGKCLPMSPRPAAPRSASQTACRRTLASEWPRSPCSAGMSTPPTMSLRPAVKRCTSKPVPIRIIPSLQDFLGKQEVFGSRDLDVLITPHEHPDRSPHSLDDGCIVGAVHAPFEGLLICALERLDGKGLGSLNGPESAPVQGAANDPLVGHFLDSVFDRHAQCHALASLREIHGLLDHFRGHEGPHPVMDEDDCGVLLEFVQAVRHGVLPFLAADDKGFHLGDVVPFDDFPETRFQVLLGEDRDESVHHPRAPNCEAVICEKKSVAQHQKLL